MRSCDDARNALDSFVRQLEEYWRLDSEHFEEVNALTCDELSAQEMTEIYSRKCSPPTGTRHYSAHQTQIQRTRLLIEGTFTTENHFQ